MTVRDNFTQRTKNILRDRAGNKCSFPSCKAPTSGASDESNEKIDSTGMACHIYAAASGIGAKRYNSNMTAAERKSVKNGIWMCYKHGKQIDNDECRFLPEILLKWKEVAERRAQIENELGRDISDESEYLLSLRLAASNVTISTVWSNENELIGNALRNSCVEAIWGKRLVSYLCGVLIERARNALTHGGATSVKLEVDTSSVRLIDDGDEYSLTQLLEHPSGRGGALSYKYLLEQYGSKVIPISRRFENKNEISFGVIISKESIKELTPCTVELKYSAMDEGYEMNVFDTCHEIYVTLPNYFGLSDMYWLKKIIPNIQSKGKDLVFVMDDIADYVPQYIMQAYPDARIINLTNL
ncbi:hypothetical protein [Photobacterium piscicola]|uniref:hypothetical protein n=1 Tax=Photobacterium piscicola TaxID=1378299 RepID=UPI002E18FCC8|nr:hypothetical protein [Photobacterium piscicola]